MTAPAAHIGTKIELILSCQNLKNTDTLSKSDPFVCVYQKVPSAAAALSSTSRDVWTMLGQTEVIDNNLNPKFTRRIKMDFYFESKQTLRFDVFDCDDAKQLMQFDKHDKLGTLTTDLGTIISQRGRATFPLVDGGRGTITIAVMELGNDVNEMLELSMRGVSLAKMDFFGKSDPYVKIFRRMKSGAETLLYRTETIKNTLDPIWQKVTFTVSELCGGNKDEPCVRFECWDADFFSDDEMGQVILSVNQIASAGGFELKDTKRSFGTLSFLNSRAYKLPSLIDFLKGGWHLSLAAAVDFTASNLDPKNPKSLHFITPTAPNNYSHAMMSVGDVLASYVTDKTFAAFGFGALLPGQQSASHFFPLTGNPTNPYVGGIQEMLQCYARTLTTVKLSGPTNFAPTITAVTAAARSRPKVYTVLLIITDGEITDVLDTIDALVAADDAPLSIVIVGVGFECDFAQMNMLDGDGGFLKASNGRMSRRDVVQFVPMKNFVNQSQEMLAREVLYEIPTQFLQWVKICRIPTPSEQQLVLDFKTPIV